MQSRRRIRGLTPPSPRPVEIEAHDEPEATLASTNVRVFDHRLTRDITTEEFVRRLNEWLSELTSGHNDLRQVAYFARVREDRLHQRIDELEKQVVGLLADMYKVEQRINFLVFLVFILAVGIISGLIFR